MQKLPSLISEPVDKSSSLVRAFHPGLALLLGGHSETSTVDKSAATQEERENLYKQHINRPYIAIRTPTHNFTHQSDPKTERSHLRFTTDINILITTPQNSNQLPTHSFELIGCSCATACCVNLLFRRQKSVWVFLQYYTITDSSFLRECKLKRLERFLTVSAWHGKHKKGRKRTYLVAEASELFPP